MALARSSADRRAISLRLVDLQYQQERLSIDAILASKQSTAAEKAIAEARLGVLDRLQANDTAAVNRDTMGPLGQYLDGIPRTVGEIQDALGSAAAEGLGSFNDGLREAIRGAGNLGDAFEAVGDRIIAKLIDIALQQAILKPLGSLFGSVLGSIGTSLAGGGSSDIVLGGAALKIGARANGGLTRAGTYVVGERGPEIVKIGNTASTVPNHALRSIRGAGQAGPAVTIGNITSNDPAMVRAMVFEGIAQAAPLLSKQASDRTLGRFQRPTM
jgi:hypothetical protein